VSGSLSPKEASQITNSCFWTCKRVSRKWVESPAGKTWILFLTWVLQRSIANIVHQSQDHIARHPFGKIPALTFPSGFTLYESRAICTYLAKKYSFPLLPASSNLEASALFDQAQSVETLYFAEPAGKIAFEKFAKRFMGLLPDEAVVANALRSVEQFFDVAERTLQKQEYMAGKEFTLVDIYYVPLVQRLFACGYGDVVLSHEGVGAWWSRCVGREAVQKMLAADEDAVAGARR
jgi:glutathione S-transferase